VASFRFEHVAPFSRLRVMGAEAVYSPCVLREPTGRSRAAGGGTASNFGVGIGSSKRPTNVTMALDRAIIQPQE
jgi:hypothetical protein